MANLILRYSLYSKMPNLNIHKIAGQLSKNNIDTIYAIGEEFGIHNRKSSSIQYKYEFNSITAVDDICDFFVNEWSYCQGVLKELNQSLLFESYLLFEFDLDGSGHPELVFDMEFITFLSNIGSELQMYFYS
jgi:hypothetical protein